MAKIIVELCQNHNGDRELLKKMIRAAKRNGADIVKGQIIFSEDLTNRERFDEGQEESSGVKKTIKRPYKAEFERMKALDLSADDYKFFVEECNRVGVTPMLTVFSRNRVPLAAKLPYQREKMVKVASYDCASVALVKELADNFDHLVISTGATLDDEIKKTAELLKSKNKKFTFLHCVTSYPNTLAMANLARMEWLRQFTPLVGWSDHSLISRDRIKMVYNGGGTNLVAALDAIIKHFDYAGDKKIKQKALLIETDMAIDADPDIQLKELKKRKINVYIIHTKPNMVGEMQGNAVAKLLNADLFRKQIEQYGFKFYSVHDRRSLENAYRDINKLEKSPSKIIRHMLRVFIYQRPLLLAIVLLFLSIGTGLIAEYWSENP